MYNKQKQDAYISRIGKKQRSFQNRRSKYKFNISWNEYNQLIKEHGNVCAICKQKESFKDFRTLEPISLAIDHCHKTNKIRGLLCRRCNQVLGSVDDNVKLLENMLIYLLK